MDDLSSLDWNASKPAQNTQPAGSKGNHYPSLRPTPPISGRSTPATQAKPLSNVPSGSKGSALPGDSFANLVTFNHGQPSKNLSLQEQQRILYEQKQGDNDKGIKHTLGQHGAQNMSAALWDSLGSGQSTPNRSGPNPATRNDDDDILAAFNASAPVNRSSHMTPPPPLRTESVETLPQKTNHGRSFGNGLSYQTRAESIEDDPFGLGMSTTKRQVTQARGSVNQEDPGADLDDVLGLLGKPVSEFPKPQPDRESPPLAVSNKPVNPQDKAIAELVDMGFSPVRSIAALDATESGLDVQTAVGWLLNQAHEESKAKGKALRSDSESDRSTRNNDSRKSASRTDAQGRKQPAWMRDEGAANEARQQPTNRSPASSERDPAQHAAELGTSFLKTANSLWKTGTKKFNQAVSDFNSEAESNQPKWMRETRLEDTTTRSRDQRRISDSGKRRSMEKQGEKPSVPIMTDEALLLEGGASRPQRKQPVRHSTLENKGQNGGREEVPPMRSHTSIKEPMRHTPTQQPQLRDHKARLTRQAVEEQNSQVYISPARRKKATPQPLPPENQPDLLFGHSDLGATPISSKASTPTSQSRPLSSTPLPTRPSPPKRNIPPLASTIFQNSVNSRKTGSLAFKRGDYIEAASHYSSALQGLPRNHPLQVPLWTNRALSYLKTGDPKASIADSTAVIQLIGPSRGAGESIDLGGDDGVKAMEPYWGKAMMRKAEALEQLEKWAEAAENWRACIAAGVGGATSMSGRTRCENALRPKPLPSAAPKKAPPRPSASALSDLGPASRQSSEAVTKLRAANAAADKLDDEKFRLADLVDGRVTQWRTGKEANLRALLASLENVLWQDSGWKKVGMGELIQPNKVKIVYMKGIGKVHPDKVSF